MIVTPPRVGERTLLLGTVFGREGRTRRHADTLGELRHLAASAGALVVEVSTQVRPTPDPRYLVGPGKLEELARSIREREVDLVIVDRELSPAQQGHLEEAWGVKVVDRTGLILDIFAQRAHTLEGKLQVELAQLAYLYPRLAGARRDLSRLGGGIGTRGPGEKKLETDRRRIQQRMRQLRRELDAVSARRALHRQARRRGEIPVVSLVGYTNAGKSTLLHRLTGADVRREDRLFSTLDPTTRRLRLPSGRTILCTDTVGFIREIPHQLVAAFRSTLEEVRWADLLLHVMDHSHPDCDLQRQVVHGVLEEIGAGDRPLIEVYNKIDRLEEDVRDSLAPSPRRVFISAATGTHLPALLEAIGAALEPATGRVPRPTAPLLPAPPCHDHPPAGRDTITPEGN
jgi:GTP-binding protein HflX